NLVNQGAIRMTASVGAASGIYSPISAGSWTNTGIIQALGGVWDSDNHTVTVSNAEYTLAGEAKTIDLFATQRLAFVDLATAQVVGVSFMAPTESADLTVTARVMDSRNLSLLESSLDPGEDILADWEFSAEGSGYAEGDPVYLSMEIGSGYDLSDLAVWLFDGSTWSEFLTSDLAYDQVYASFTATDLCGYALTGTASVPIPGAVWLLGSGLLGLVGIRRKRR
ncbi:MAG: hypothetical protein RQ801_14130, partial [Spirochaetaceae bacterium]|nr:hypothetical protein [Spirochaetaceae bacterium]